MQSHSLLVYELIPYLTGETLPTDPTFVSLETHLRLEERKRKRCYDITFFSQEGIRSQHPVSGVHIASGDTKCFADTI